MVSSYLPYPLYSGGAVRLFNLIKYLSKKHEITLVCERRDKQTEEDIKEVKKYCKEVIAVSRLPQWSFSNILKTGFSTLPFLLIGHINPEMKENLIRLLREKTFNLIHIETFYVYQNLPRTYLPVVLVEHNVEYLVYARYKNTASTYLKPFLNLDILKIKKWEEFYWKKANSLVAVSEEDKKLMKKEAYVVPNGVSLSDFPFKKNTTDKKNKTILFMGDFKWIQNQKAVKFILEEIWPHLESRIKNKELKIKLWVVGKNITEDIKNLSNSKNIVFDENAPDKTSEIYKKADILLAPITVGGGTSFKILESMASGVPVVTTNLGVKGIGAKNNIHALTSENASDLAENVFKLLEDKVEYEKIRKNARKLIEENFSWEKISEKLEKVYKETLIS